MPDTRASSEVWRSDAAHEHGAQQRLRSVGHRRPRQRGHAVRALAVAPEDFTVAQFSTKVAAMTGRTDADYTTR
jgi:heme-degrading monooxygenase HmoA